MLFSIARFVSNVCYFFDEKGRSAVKTNLKAVMGNNLSKRAFHKAGRRIFYNFSVYLVEFFRYTSIAAPISLPKFVIAIDCRENKISVFIFN